MVSYFALRHISVAGLFIYLPKNTLLVLLFVSLTLGFPSIGYAQQRSLQVTQQTIAWYRLEERLEFSPAWRVIGEAEVRPFDFTSSLFQRYIRGRLQYQRNKQWTFGVGFAYFQQSTHPPQVSGNLMVPELRPHQEITYQQPALGRMAMMQHFRLEERFFHNNAKGELTPGYRFNFRFRYRLELNYALNQRTSSTGLWRLRTHGEVMFNAGRQIVYNVFDQARFYVGVNYQLTKSLAVEAGYLKSFQQRESGYQYWNRDIIRLALQHRWSLKKSE